MGRGHQAISLPRVLPTSTARGQERGPPDAPSRRSGGRRPERLRQARSRGSEDSAGRQSGYRCLEPMGCGSSSDDGRILPPRGPHYRAEHRPRRAMPGGRVLLPCARVQVPAPGEPTHAPGEPLSTTCPRACSTSTTWSTRTYSGSSARRPYESTTSLYGTPRSITRRYRCSQIRPPCRTRRGWDSCSSSTICRTSGGRTRSTTATTRTHRLLAITAVDGYPETTEVGVFYLGCVEPSSELGSPVTVLVPGMNSRALDALFGAVRDVVRNGCIRVRVPHARDGAPTRRSWTGCGTSGSESQVNTPRTCRFSHSLP